MVEDEAAIDGKFHLLIMDSENVVSSVTCVLLSTSFIIKLPLVHKGCPSLSSWQGVAIGYA